MKKIILVFLALILFASSSWAIGISFPSAPVPTARFATGATYDYYGGYMDFDKNSPLFAPQVLPFSMHGINAFFTYAPITYVNFGVELGARDVNTHPDSKLSLAQDELNGTLGLSAGAHLKLATPYFADVFALVATGKGGWFYSEGNKNDVKWYYTPNGIDTTWVNWNNGGKFVTIGGGFSFHVKRFGYISFGAKYLDVWGGIGWVPEVLPETKWVNDAYVGGWAAFDYFPRTRIEKFFPFISFEFGFFPNSEFFAGGRPIVRNASFSVTIGAITRKLYGNSDENWRP